MLWNAVIFGPADTPFEDGTFKLVMTFEEKLPQQAAARQVFVKNVSPECLWYWRTLFGYLAESLEPDLRR